MGCLKKERGEHCLHHHCQYHEETGHGYECVDIIAGKYCEVGEGCLKKCEYSFQEVTIAMKIEIEESLDLNYPV